MQVNNIQSGQIKYVYGVMSEEGYKKENKTEVPEESFFGRDEYVPSEEEEPIGLYAVSQDDEGNPRIDYDPPEKPDKKDGNSPESSKKSRSQSVTGNTDKADREIERLKKRAKQLEQQISSAEGKERERLEKLLASVRNELSQKDNDTYRRQNSVFS